MLRIREYNKITGKKIELEELEKFGFKENENGLYYEKNFSAVCYDGEEEHKILIYKSKRNIVLEIMNNDYTYHSFDEELGRIEDTIYDLTEAGYVEKVKEE